MFTNYLKIAYRNILKNKAFSLLNIFGLALSMAVGFIILLLYQDGHSYDKFHLDADRIYRVNTVALRKDKNIEYYATSPVNIGKQMELNFSWIDKITTLTLLKPKRDDNPNETVNAVIIRDNQRFTFDGKVADNNFFEIFNFKLSQGDIHSVLREPNTIVLTDELSKKLFKSKSPINEVVQIDHLGTYKITGVLPPAIEKTHLQFDALLSSGVQDKISDELSNYNAGYTYVKIKPNTNIKQAKESVNTFFANSLNKLPIQSQDASLSFDFQPLPDITPGYSMANAMGKGLPSHLLLFIAMMGLVVLASSVFNYTNLTLAKSYGRTKEIGVRKVLGANRTQVILQLLSEGLVLSMMAFGVAFLLMLYLKYELNKLQSIHFFDLNVNITPSSLLYFLLFSILVGCLAGALPAITISKLNSISTLRKFESVNLFKRVRLSNVLLVIQFVFFMLFIMIVTTLHKQVSYAINMNYGFNLEHVYNVPLQGISADVAKSKFASVPGVKKISALDIPMGTYTEASYEVKVNTTDEYTKVSGYSVDHEMIPNFGLTLVAGENFTSKPSGTHIIVNQLFTEKYKLGAGSDAIGKTVFLNDSTIAIIKGVVKDFLFKPADYMLEPLILKNVASDWQILNLKINSQNIDNTIMAFKTAWKEIAPGFEFKGEFYKSTLQNNYAILKDVNKVILFFTFLGLVIALMGLLGMVIYTVEKRQKEVSLRKVIGATEKNIIFLLSKGYFWMLLAGFGISIPVGLYSSKLILNNFVNRIDAGLNIVLPGVLILTLLSIIIIGSQTIRASFINPIKSLRTE